MKVQEELQLTYCTNIHPGNEWKDVEAAIRNNVPEVKKRVSRDKPFGIGLRLSNLAAEELLKEENLRNFKNYLDQENLYVFTINGFPYGVFHGESVKEAVHEPDWRTAERGDYTIRLARILAFLLSDNVREGSISTSPLSYKPRVDKNDPDLWEQCLHQIVRVVIELISIQNWTGKYIHIDLEPEPDGLLETSEEVVDFFRNHLLVRGAAILEETCGFSPEEAKRHLLKHVGVCLDTCHMAIEYETADSFISRLDDAGIHIGKVQISSALKIPFPGTGLSAEARNSIVDSLLPFAESTYLHQVIQKNSDGTLLQYRDLPEALEKLSNNPVSPLEWRIHFHVPVFVDSYDSFSSTREAITDTLKLLGKRKFTRHLEIETYTWEVLPSELKTDLIQSVTREFEWVIQELKKTKASQSA